MTIREAMARGAAELRAIHTHGYKDCEDQGPNTCPTWEAIHALEDTRPDPDPFEALHLTEHRALGEAIDEAEGYYGGHVRIPRDTWDEVVKAHRAITDLAQAITQAKRQRQA